MLSINLLEKTPEEYYRQIYNLNIFNENISDILNTQEYKSWYGTHLHCLYHLVGELEPTYDENNCLVTGFYGADYSINNELGIKILKEMVKGGANINIEDYYNDTVKDKLDNNGLTKRLNNQNFKLEIEKLYD
jgi:hypothetical protein